jgi:hypothetical protein
VKSGVAVAVGVGVGVGAGVGVGVGVVVLGRPSLWERTCAEARAGAQDGGQRALSGAVSCRRADGRTGTRPRCARARAHAGPRVRGSTGPRLTGTRRHRFRASPRTAEVSPSLSVASTERPRVRGGFDLGWRPTRGGLGGLGGLGAKVGVGMGMSVGMVMGVRRCRRRPVSGVRCPRGQGSGQWVQVLRWRVWSEELRESKRAREGECVSE